MMDGYSIDLDDLDAAAWSMFDSGVSSSRHAFHLPCIATIRKGRPRVRTVVLRGAYRNDRTLSFHTESRSSKVADLAQSPEIEWLFLHAKGNLAARLHYDSRGLADATWIGA